MNSQLALAYLLLNVAGVSQCRDLEGQIIFTDRSCPTNSTPVIMQKQPFNILSFEPTQHLSITKRSKKQGRTRTPALDRQQECQRTRAQLKVLRVDRRRGYSLKEAAELDSKLEKLKSDRRKFC